jgi:5-(carboxyamino)imidazole ribonucleotide synthase
VKSGWESLQGQEGIYEAFVDFEKELSVIVARTVHGGMQAFPVFENSHLDHILDLTFAPAAIDPQVAEQAVDLASQITNKLEVIGLLTVEMFLAADGRLLVNELAPRPHNSGHLTIDACVTSQFEQQVRAVCSLPLGSTEMREPAAMANLLGQLWGNGEPDWGAALEDSRVKLHLYGKAEARRGRKMGHMTATGATAKEALARVVQARNRL